MASGKLFEALTGYEETSARTTPEVMGAEAESAVGPNGEKEPSSADFVAILEQIKRELDTDPETAARKLHDAFGISSDPDDVRAYLDEALEIARQGDDAPSLRVEEPVEGPELLGAEAVGVRLSDSYKEDNIPERYWRDLPEIEIRPDVHRFEDDSPLGILGWAIFNGPQALAVPRAFPSFREKFYDIPGAETFRRHGAENTFVYPLDMPADGSPLRVALFADFGTGLSHSRYIARQIHVDAYPVAIHVGDVYYTGTGKQYRKYFEEPLLPAIRNGTKVFVIPDNHDGYSGFHAYTSFLDRHRFQQGSYFAIETEHVQFIGMDALWHSERGRLTDERVMAWLDERVRAGRDHGRVNVLASGQHPYAYGDEKITDLSKDIVDVVGDELDLWFWGDTHYNAFFTKGTQTPYFGSCIGHGGYPHKGYERGRTVPPGVTTRFLETGSRYEPEPVRTDRGMNGFCSFEISADGQIKLHYVDWRGQNRCHVEFERRSDGSLELNHVVDVSSST